MSRHPQRRPGTLLERAPLLGRIAWVLFAVLFFNAGLNFTVWLLEPHNFAGGWAWLWVALFPPLVPAFFVINRHLGCASGGCASGVCTAPGPSPAVDRPRGDASRMPAGTAAQRGPASQ